MAKFLAEEETLRYKLSKIMDMANESENFGIVDYIIDEFYDSQNDKMNYQIDEMCRKLFVVIQNGWFNFSELWDDSCVGEIAKDKRCDSLFHYGVETGALLMCKYLVSRSK